MSISSDGWDQFSSLLTQFWSRRRVHVGTDTLSRIHIPIRRLKGAMSPRFCSFVVKAVLIIQLVTLFHAQNVAFNAKGRYQVNFRVDTKLLLVLSDFSKTQ